MSAPYYSDDAVTLYHGDCLDVMRKLPAQSIDAIVTSPPYGMQRASTYGGIEQDEYPAWAVSVFEEFKRVLKPSGSVLWNISPNVKDGVIADYVLKMRLAIRNAGWFEHDELIWVKPDKMPTGKPKWPVRAWESIFWYSLTKDPYVDATKCGNRITENRRASAAADPHAFRGRDARLGWDHLGKGYGKMGEFSRAKNHISLAVRSIGNDVDHPAPFPTELAKWLTRMFTPLGGTVLEPFAGSGTTAEACVIEGFKCIAIEREAEYMPLIVQRLTKPMQTALDLGGTA